MRPTIPILLVPLLALAGGAVGCVPYVAAQNGPPPLASYRSFIVEPMHFEQLSIGGKSEAEYLAGRNPSSRASWEGDKQAIAQEFLAGMMAHTGALQIGPAVQQPGPGTLIVRPICQFIEPGSFNGFFNLDTQVRVTEQILDPSGQLVDQVELDQTAVARMENPSSGGRLREAAAGLGHRAASHLHRQTGV
jgi:hypothetical protein